MTSRINIIVPNAFYLFLNISCAHIEVCDEVHSGHKQQSHMDPFCIMNVASEMNNTQQLKAESLCQMMVISHIK